MASAGGHWTKASGGPNAGEYVFIPAIKSGLISLNGDNTYKSQDGIYQGGLAVVKGNNGEWYVIHKESELNLGSFANQDAATAAMAQMNEDVGGKVWGSSAQEIQANSGTMQPVMVNAQKQYSDMSPGDAKAALTQIGQTTPPAPKQAGVSEVTAAAQQQAAQVQAPTQAPAPGSFSTQADFVANAQNVTITSSYKNEKVDVQGVIVKDGVVAVTQNPETGKYHTTDLISGKTMTVHDTAEGAFAEANQYAKGTTSIAPPPLPASYGVFKGDSAAAQFEQEIKKAQQAQAGAVGISQNAVSALAGYQDSDYGAINSALWKNKVPGPTTLSQIKGIDEAMTKLSAPRDMVVVRAQDKSHPLYSFAKAAEVGGKYTNLGYDSASCNFNNTWSGGAVRIVYRVPKGTPGTYIRTFTSGFASEREFLIARNLTWNIVGKTVSPGGQIEMTVELDPSSFGG